MINFGDKYQNDYTKEYYTVYNLGRYVILLKEMGVNRYVSIWNEPVRPRSKAYIPGYTKVGEVRY